MGGAYICAVPENIQTTPMEGVLFGFEDPLSLGISNDLSWGGYGLFLELHIVHVEQQEQYSLIVCYESHFGVSA